MQYIDAVKEVKTKEKQKRDELYQSIPNALKDAQDSGVNWVWIGDGEIGKEKRNRIVQHVMYQKFTNYSPTIFSFFVPTLLYVLATMIPIVIQSIKSNDIFWITLLSYDYWYNQLGVLILAQMLLLPFSLQFSIDRKKKKYINSNIKIVNGHHYISRNVAIKYLAYLADLDKTINI